MEFGQMSIKGLSTRADYLQLDICGHSPIEAVNRYLSYETEIPIVLHGDWTKKGFSENNIGSRLQDYVSIIQELQKKTNVKGFTMHPTFRKKVPFEQFWRLCKEIESSTGVEVWVENRSNSRIWLSHPEEICEFSYQHTMTIDLAQLYISCGYSNSVLKETLLNMCWRNIRELHISNVKRSESHTFVARKLSDGEIDLKDLIPYIVDVPNWTFEILGGIPTFENQIEECMNWFN